MDNQVERVFIIGLDGVGNFIKNTDTPHIHKLLDNSMLTYDAQAVYPTISAECWGSVLHGVSPEKHGLNNEIVSTSKFPEDSPYPSIFKIIKKERPKSKLASFSVWDPINQGVIEQSTETYLESKSDPALVESICNYIKENPDLQLMYVQLDAPDGAGHEYGYGSDEFLESVTKADQHVGQIIKAIETAELMESSLIILLADHGGGGDDYYSHGSKHPQDMTVFWGCYGAGINKNIEIEDDFSIMNTAAITLKALGINPPLYFEGKVPKGFFTTKSKDDHK